MFDFGASGEKIVGSWLQSKRVMHFALHPLDLLKHGPRVIMSDTSTVACPDFICWGTPPHPAAVAENQFFIEVKRLRKWWNDAGTLQAGIEENKVHEYRELAKGTGEKVYVYFLHLNEVMQGDGLFCGDISALRHARVTAPGEKRLLMFNKDALVLLEANLAWHARADPEDADDDP